MGGSGRAPRRDRSGRRGEAGRAPRRWSFRTLLDGFFFGYAGLAAIWLAVLLLGESFQWGWFGILFFIVFWIVLAYLVLPRLHRILTTVYVPDYFIGRARTSDGLLGDPVNLALLGGEAEVHRAMERARWTRADDVTLASSWRIVVSTLTRRSYDEAPVSPLFLFGRMQDFAYQQEVAGNPAKRHHVRFWRTPDGWLLPGGRRVDWLAAGTFDRAVGFSLFTLQITHKVDADIDIERDHIVSTLIGVPGVEVRVLRDFSTGYHSRNGGGDSIRTDGDLPIVDVGGVRAGVPQGVPDAGGDEPEAAAGAPPQPASAAARAEPDKRPAFESPAELARHAPPPPPRRPGPLVAGVVLIVLRILAGVVWLVALAVDWSRIVRDEAGALVEALGPAEAAAASGLALTVIVVIGSVVLAIEVLFALLVWRGVDWARIVVMIVAGLSIAAFAIDYFAGGQDITVRTTLLTLALDILVLLALSSRAARSWSRPGPFSAAALVEPLTRT